VKLTREQAESRKDAAVRFVDNVLGDPDRADEIEEEDLEDYAARRKIELINPRRSMGIANSDPRTKDQLLDEIADLQDEYAALQDQLDAIQDVLSGPNIEEEEDGDDDQD
jgi:hypothetical protein